MARNAALDPVTEYARGVVGGEIVAGKWVRIACERHFQDLARQGADEFPYVFDEDKAQKVLDFFPYCRHVKGPLAGKPIRPEPFMEFIFGSLFGWVHKDTGYRRFRKAYTQLGRGNAKSTGQSVLSLYMLCADGEMGAEVYATATKKDQARIVFNAARLMVMKSPDLLRRIDPSKAKLEHVATGSEFKALSRDDQQYGDGLAPHLGTVDEYHRHPTSEMYDILSTALQKRAQPLLATITTAGEDLSSPCYAEYQYCCKVLDGTLDNEEYFVYIAQLDEDDNPKDERTWIKANPLVAATDWGMRSLRADFREAIDDPRKMRIFLIKNLNQWVDQRVDGYMPMDKWHSCKDEIPELRGVPCYLGVDLASKIDLASITAEFPLQDGRIAVLSHSFIPGDKLEERRKTDKQPFGLWVDQGWITAIDGGVVDQNVMLDWIDEQVAERGWVAKEVCTDPWSASQFGIELEKRGYVAVEIIQGPKTLSEPTKNIRERVLAKTLIHDGNPVLGWAMSNAVTRMDHNENIMLDKKKSRERIDPAAALMNAHARMVRFMEEEEFQGVIRFS